MSKSLYNAGAQGIALCGWETNVTCSESIPNAAGFVSAVLAVPQTLSQFVDFNISIHWVSDFLTRKV